MPSQARTASADPPYPPSPWRLAGTLRAGLFLVRTDALPFLGGTGLRPLSLFGRSLACVLFARYDGPGVLRYDELLAAVLVRHGGGLGFTIPRIWVDSAASASGGRALWAIPKQIGSFEAHAAGPAARDAAGAPIAALAEAGGVALPGRWRLPLPLVQPSGPALVFPKGAARGVVLVTRARWRFAPAGPLGWLSNATPLVSGRLDGARLVFGAGDPDLGP